MLSVGICLLIMLSELSELQGFYPLSSDSVARYVRQLVACPFGLLLGYHCRLARLILAEDDLIE